MLGNLENAVFAAISTARGAMEDVVIESGQIDPRVMPDREGVLSSIRDKATKGAKGVRARTAKLATMPSRNIGQSVIAKFRNHRRPKVGSVATSVVEVPQQSDVAHLVTQTPTADVLGGELPGPPQIEPPSVVTPTPTPPMNDDIVFENNPFAPHPDSANMSPLDKLSSKLLSLTGVYLDIILISTILLVAFLVYLFFIRPGTRYPGFGLVLEHDDFPYGQLLVDELSYHVTNIRDMQAFVKNSANRRGLSALFQKLSTKNDFISLVEELNHPLINLVPKPEAPSGKDGGK